MGETMEVTAIKIRTPGTVILSVGAAASGLVAFALLTPRWLLVREPLRVSLDSLGGFAALMLACLLLITWNTEERGRLTLWTSCGLIGMGFLDGFHAALSPGNISLWLHAAAVAVGGTLFALAWLPEKELTLPAAYHAPKLVGASALAFGLVSIISPGWLPLMSQGGLATPQARVLTALGSLGFFVAAARFLSGERTADRGSDVWLATICMLFGTAGLVAGFSANSERAWWLWHLVSLSAYVSALVMTVTSGGCLEEPAGHSSPPLDKLPGKPSASPSGPDKREVQKEPDGGPARGNSRTVPVCLEAVMDSVREPLLALDGELKIITASKSFYQTFKVSPEETRGCPLYELSDRQWDIPELRELMEELLHRGTKLESFEVSHTFPAIGFSTMKFDAHKITSDGARGEMILLSIENITKRKAAEEALRKARRALEALSHCNKALVDADEEANLIHQICQTIVDKGGYSKAWVAYTEEGTSSSLRLMSLAEADHAKLEHTCLSCIEAQGNKHPTHEAMKSLRTLVSHRPPIKAGSKADCSRTASCPYPSCIALPLKNGRQVLGTLNVCSQEPNAFDTEEIALLEELSADLAYGVTTLRTRDEHQRAEEELRQAHETLQNAYEKLEKAKAVATASEKLASVGRLTAGVSHEILNPLNGIVINLHYLLSDEETPPKVAEELKEMLTQAGRISKISQDLLSFARQRLPERHLLDLNETLIQTLGLLEHEFRLTNIDVELRLADDLPPVSADKDQLQQVILNLLSNSRDAMPSGGQLTLETAEVPSLFSEGGRLVEFRLTDTGPGIPPEHMDRIFDPFFTTKEEGQGTGLGLSVCQGIVENHGGTIWTENAPGGGSVFVVRLEVEDDNHA